MGEQRRTVRMRSTAADIIRGLDDDYTALAFYQALIDEWPDAIIDAWEIATSAHPMKLTNVPPSPPEDAA